MLYIFLIETLIHEIFLRNSFVLESHVLITFILFLWQFKKLRIKISTNILNLYN